MTNAKRIVFDLGGKARISPPLWPNHKLDVQPGDLEKFVPRGNGVYGYDECKGGNPFTNAPSQERNGGVIYFGNGIAGSDFEALMRMLNVDPISQYSGPQKDYALFVAESERPRKDRYLTQMRIVSKFALRFMFGALTSGQHDKFPEQNLSVQEVLWEFIEHECERWGTSYDSSALAGLLGGDGDYACEELAFGFMVENDYHHVYRIWSRVRLVTK